MFKKVSEWLTSLFTGRSVWCWLVIQTLVLLCFNWFILSPRTWAWWSAATSGPYVAASGNISSRRQSVTFSTFFSSLPPVLSSVQVSRRPNFKELSQDHGRCQRWLNKKRIKAFYTPVFSDSLRHGAQFLMQVWSNYPALVSQVYRVSMSHQLLKWSQCGSDSRFSLVLLQSWNSNQRHQWSSN